MIKDLRSDSRWRIIGPMSEPVATFYADLDFKIDVYRSGTTWTSIVEGDRRDVVPGAPVVMADEDDAFEATVTDIDSVGPHVRIHWDRPVSISGINRQHAPA